MSDLYADYSSYFIKDKALFGSYPTQDQVNYLIEMGVKYFIDLTVPGEVNKIYNTNQCYYLNFPIIDRKIPVDVTQFTAFIISIHSLVRGLDGKNKIYIHCKGGHGRAGIVVAALLCLYNGNMNTYKALELTTQYHNERKQMRQKWRDIGSPQTKTQKGFVHRLFGDMQFYRAYRRGPSHGFSNYSFHTISVEENDNLLPLGVFPSSESLFQATKLKHNKAYVEKHMQSKNPRISKKIGDRISVSQDWINNRYETMRAIIKHKIGQHDEIRSNLLKTALKNIVFNSRTDSFFGSGPQGNGRNNLGKILMDIRNEIYENYGAHTLSKKYVSTNGKAKLILDYVNNFT